MDAEGQFVICVDPGTCIGVQGGISNKVVFRPWSWRRLMPGHLGDGITEGEEKLKASLPAGSGGHKAESGWGAGGEP